MIGCDLSNVYDGQLIRIAIKYEIYILKLIRITVFKISIPAML